MATKPLISANELSTQYRDLKWVCIDCRFDLEAPLSGRKAYRQGHIPGAVYADLEQDLSAPKTGKNGRHPLPSIQAMTEQFSQWGIGSETVVAAYDADTGAYASRLWWMLKYMGHDQVVVLDGGFTAWQSEGLPVEQGENTRQSVQFEAHPRPEMLVSMQSVETLRHDPAYILIDSRSPERYRGEEEPYDRVAGRIPGAINRFWKDNLDDDNRFRDAKDLQRAFDLRRSSAPTDHLVVYCGSGVTGCHNLLALEQAGYSGAKLYAGSYSEWSSDLDNPIEQD